MPETVSTVSRSFIRHLARWRAEHLQRAAWQIENKQARWEMAPIPRYENNNGRTNLTQRSAASPRTIWVQSHVNVHVPAIETAVFDWPEETLTLSEHDMRTALYLMRDHDLIDAWETYARESEPINIWGWHERDGIREGFRAKYRPGLAHAVLAFALPSLHWSTGRHWTLPELGGRKTDTNRNP